MHDIFISYAREDTPTAQRLAELLSQRGWSVWWDSSILHGASYESAIEQELDTAKCVLVLWSKASVASHWVKDEARVGLARGVLIPVLIEATKIPLGFRGIQTADLTGWEADPAKPEVQRLLKSIEHKAGAPSIAVVHDEQKIVEPASTSTVQARTVFQKELLQLLEYARDRFERIKGPVKKIRGINGPPFKTIFTISGTTDNCIYSMLGDTLCFHANIIDKADEQTARAVFEERSEEIRHVLSGEWTFSVKEDKKDKLIKRSMNADHPQSGLGLGVNLMKMDDGNYVVQLLVFSP